MGRHRRAEEAAWAQWEDEFNDLLTPILGYAEFLQIQLGPDSELHQDVREIYLAARRLQRLGERIFWDHTPGHRPRRAKGERSGRAKRRPAARCPEPGT